MPAPVCSIPVARPPGCGGTSLVSERRAALFRQQQLEPRQTQTGRRVRGVLRAPHSTQDTALHFLHVRCRLLTCWRPCSPREKDLPNLSHWAPTCAPDPQQSVLSWPVSLCGSLSWRWDQR